MKTPANGFSREIQVGLFVFTACLVIAAFSFRITDNPIFRSGTEFTAYFDDATGFFKNSKVKMAGIDIGIVRNIELVNGRARVVLLINKGIQIPENAQVVPRPLGILGDKVIEIVIPKPEVELEKVPAPPVIEKQEKSSLLRNLKRKNGFSMISFFIPTAQAQTPDQSPAPVKSIINEKEEKKESVLKTGNSSPGIEDVTRQLSIVAGDLRTISGTLRQLISEKKHVDSPLGRSLNNIENLTGNLNEIIVENQKAVHTSFSNIAQVSEKINGAMDAFNEKQVRQDLKSLGMAAGNLSSSLESLKSITKKIDAGEGTIGRLVNDSTTVQELNKALRSVNTAVNRFERTVVRVDSWVEYNLNYSRSKAVIGLELSPREDSGYLANMIIGGDPVTRTVTREESVNGGTAISTKTVTKDESAFRYSFQFYKNFWGSRFRLGMWESSGGLGVDLPWKSLSSSTHFDFYGLGVESTPNFKIMQRIVFFEHLQLNFGAEKLFGIGRRDSKRVGGFIGLGLFFDESDLGSLLALKGAKS